jgi:putative ABC transport system substrate-binding protein
MKRREFITLLGGAGAAWPLAARAQQGTLPVIAFINGSTAEAATRNVAAFREGMSKTGYVEGQNVSVEYHWLEGRYERLTPLLADLVLRGVAVIATPAVPPAAIAAKSATTTIPIVFGVAGDPIKLGLLTSLPRPDGNATGVNYFIEEATAKRLEIMHELMPDAVRIAVLVHPGSPAVAEATLQEIRGAAAALKLQIQVLKAGTIDEINSAFLAMGRERAEALFIGPNGFFASRGAQFAMLALRDRMPASYLAREMVEAGLLMSYGPRRSQKFSVKSAFTPAASLKAISQPSCR